MDISQDGAAGRREYPKVLIGRVPIMLRSTYCALHSLGESDLAEAGECPYDQGGYFVVNGGEKVIVAQEKMAHNHCYVFKKKPPSKYSYVAEIRSCAEGGYRPLSSMFVKMAAKGSCIRVTLPYIRKDIPVVVVFRALGFVADRDVLEHVCYDFADKEMMELLRPSLEEAAVVQDQNVALDFIGKRGSSVGALQQKRVQYAKDVLQKEVLPHVGVEELCETKKAFYLGYAVHQLLLVALGRRREDDRDNYANKRLDLSGPLLGGLFRLLFRKLAKDAKMQMQTALDRGKNDLGIDTAVRARIITRGLQYSLATGNWGTSGETASKTGVSQTLNRLTYSSTLSHLRRLNSPIGREGLLF